MTLFIYFFCFLWLHLWHMEAPRLGVKSELQLTPLYKIWTFTPQPQQHRLQASAVTLARPHGNTGSLTHWARPGIKLASSWILVRFLTCWAKMGTPYNSLKIIVYWDNTLLVGTKINMTLKEGCLATSSKTEYAFTLWPAPQSHFYKDT